MKIEFAKMEEKLLPNFKGGEKNLGMRMFDDGACKIMRGRLELPSGCTPTRATARSFTFWRAAARWSMTLALRRWRPETATIAPSTTPTA